MIYLTWIILSILCGIYASGKGKSGFGYFLLSVLLSPLIGFVAALIAKEDTVNIEKKEMSLGVKRKCPFCAELVKSEAIICKHCGKDIDKHKVIQNPTSSDVRKAYKKIAKDDKSQEVPNNRCNKCFAIQTKKDVEKGQCWKCDESFEK